MILFCVSRFGFLIALTDKACYFPESVTPVCLPTRNNMNCTVRWAPRSSCVKFVRKMTRMWRLSHVAIWCALPVSLHGRWGKPSCDWSSWEMVYLLSHLDPRKYRELRRALKVQPQMHINESANWEFQSAWLQRKHKNEACQRLFPMGYRGWNSVQNWFYPLDFTVSLLPPEKFIAVFIAHF